MSLFLLPQKAPLVRAKRFDMLHAVLCEVWRLPQPGQDLVLKLMAHIAGHAAKGLRGKALLKPVVVWQDNVKEKQPDDLHEMYPAIEALRQNMPRLPLHYGRTSGHGTAGLGLFDILQTHEAKRGGFSQALWVRLGIWAHIHMSSADRAYFARAVIAIESAVAPELRSAVATICLAIATARDESMLSPGESVSVRHLIDFSQRSFDKRFRAISNLPSERHDFEELIDHALTHLLENDFIASHSRDPKGMIWLTIGAHL